MASRERKNKRKEERKRKVSLLNEDTRQRKEVKTRRKKVRKNKEKLINANPCSRRFPVLGEVSLYIRTLPNH